MKGAVLSVWLSGIFAGAVLIFFIAPAPFFAYADVLIVGPMPEMPKPIADAKTATTSYKTAISVQLSGTNVPDSIESLVFNIVNNPTSGSLGSIQADNTITYTPNSGFSGADSFTYKAIDGADESDPSTVSITVEDPVIPPCTENCFSNVLFLPGIESSRLYRPKVIGDGEDRLWEPGIADNLQDLYLDPHGQSLRDDVYAKSGDVLDETPIRTNVYKSFIKKIDELKAQGLINNWRSAPYDWRISLEEILEAGLEKDGRIQYVGISGATSTPYIIQELKHLAASSKTGKVTIVAHSNGGLVGKLLIKKLGSAAADLIDRIIFVAVPQAGTPVAIGAGLHGYDQDIMYGLVVSKSSARTFASTTPMLYNLLPSAKYFTHVDDPVVRFEASLPDWIEKYGDTIHSQEKLRAFLIDSFGRVDAETGDTDQPIQLYGSLLSDAEAVHASLDGWAPPAGIELIQLAGWGVPTTMKGLKYSIKGTGVKPEPDFTIDGDGTVVVPSALWTNTSASTTNYWVDLQKYNARIANQISFGLLNINHADILEVPALLDFVSDTITDITKSPSDYSYLSTQSPTATDKRLRFELHSPLTLDLFDDQGRHTGISTKTPEQIEVQIPGTDYQEFGDIKYIFTDGVTPFQIVLQGTATGTFTFVINELVGDTSVASTTFADIPVTPQTTAKMDLPSGLSSASNLAVDEDGDGSINFSYASSTGQKIPDEPTTVQGESSAAAESSASSGGSVVGGGNGSPFLLPSPSMPVTSATSTPTTTIATIISTTSTSSIQATSSAENRQPVVSTTTQAAKPTAKAVSPKTTITKTKVQPQNTQKAQVAAAAQTISTGYAKPSLWTRIFQWIIAKLKL